MALDLKLQFVDVDFVNNRYHLSDTTGMYSAANLGGYGIDSDDPNPSKLESDDEIDEFEIEVIRPDDSTLTKNIDNISFISPSDNDGYDIVDISIDDDASIVNGVYKFKLIISVGGLQLTSTTITQYIYNLDELETQINTKFATDLDFCNFPDSICNKSLLTLWSYYRALKSAINEENSVRADYLSTQILKIIS